MRKLEYNTVMCVDYGLRHAMAGVSTSSTGNYLTSRGIRYYFAETTVVGIRIDHMKGGTSGWHLIPH